MTEPASTYPDSLSPAFWERKKGSLPPGSELPDKLKALQKKHGALDWKLFDGEWPSKARSEAELDEAYALRERVYRSSVVPLKRDANDVANAARSMTKDKAAAKPALDAAKAIGAAVNDFADAIDAVADDLAKARDKARPALAKAAAKAAAEAKDDEDDEEDTPVLLTTKMIPLIRELRKGDVRMYAMIGRAGANTAVLIMRKPIAPAKRKLLAEAVDAKGGAKFITGEVLLEDKALTFVLQSPAAGLAKRLRAALLNQVDLRLMVKVRGDDGVEDRDGENEEGPPAGDKTADKREAPSLQAMYEQAKREQYPRLAALVREAGEDRDLVLNLMGKAGKAEKIADWAAGLEIYDQLGEILDRQTGNGAAATASAQAGKPGDADGDAAARWEANLAAWTPAIKAAMAARGPDAAAMAKLFVQATALAKPGGDIALALARLSECHELAELAAEGEGSAATAGNREAAMAAWQTERSAAVATLKQMAGVIAAAKHASSAKALLEINAVMKNLTAMPASRNQVAEIERYLREDEVVHDVCELAREIRTPLLRALGRLKPQLAA